MKTETKNERINLAVGFILGILVGICSTIVLIDFWRNLTGLMGY